MSRKVRQSQDERAGVTHAVVQIDALAPHPRNYRKHPDQQINNLAASLVRFSQVRSIVVQEGADGRYLIVAGHGLVEAARREGYTERRADVIPATWNATAIEGYLVADNELSRGAQDDQTALAALLQEQANAGEHLESLGYSGDELAALLDGLGDNALADEEPPTFKDYDESVEDDMPTEMCQQC